MLRNIVFWLMASAFSGSAYAALQESGKSFLRKDYESDLQELMPLAKSGDPSALNVVRLLGDAYRDGEVVVQNYPEAVRIYQFLADLGDVKGTVALGTMYLSGRGVKKDVQMALRLYRVGADKGDSFGQAVGSPGTELEFAL